MPNTRILAGAIFVKTSAGGATTTNADGPGEDPGVMQGLGPNSEQKPKNMDTATKTWEVSPYSGRRPWCIQKGKEVYISSHGKTCTFSSKEKAQRTTNRLNGKIVNNPDGPNGAVNSFPVDLERLRSLIQARSTRLENGCLVWDGYCIKGYPQSKVCGKTRLLHRALFVGTYGKIRDGYQIDHTCNNSKCLNIDHLEEKTARDNTLRSSNPYASKAKQDRCSNGHEFDIFKTDSRGRRRRGCSICNQERHKRYWKEESKS